MKVALTFDDGPAQWTVPILDLLRDAGAHATFFVIGDHIAGNEDTIKRMLADGHEVGNHTKTHPRLSECGVVAARIELEMTQHMLWQVTGEVPTLWRAPHFDLPDHARNLAVNMGLGHIGCDIDPGDWATESPAGIADHVSRRLRDGDIVDLHDGMPRTNSGTKTRQPTVDAVAILLAELTDVDFVTVSQL